jgi:hypothetical protein
MASIYKRGPYQWQVLIRRKSFETQARVFNTKAEAEAWAQVTESEPGLFRDVWEMWSSFVSVEPSGVDHVNTCILKDHAHSPNRGNIIARENSHFPTELLIRPNNGQEYA